MWSNINIFIFISQNGEVYFFAAGKKSITLKNTNQRNIANITGVALGNIPQVIKGLKEQGKPLN